MKEIDEATMELHEMAAREGAKALIAYFADPTAENYQKAKMGVGAGKVHASTYASQTNRAILKFSMAKHASRSLGDGG